MYLLDTHVLLNAILSPQKLSSTHTQLLRNESSTFYFSNISVWEISLKYSIGKLHLHHHDPTVFLGICLQSGFKLTEISIQEIASFYQMPLSEQHKDPFDRMLVWQCIQSSHILLSEDGQFEQYRKLGLQVIR
jgi:PIN domain nuclease of toxin-antitoxin system